MSTREFIEVRSFLNVHWTDEPEVGSIIRYVPRARIRDWHHGSLPFGWSVDYCYWRPGIEIGPSWIIEPRRFWRWFLYRSLPPIARWAIARGLIELHDGDLYSAARWFPTFPRFVDG